MVDNLAEVKAAPRGQASMHGRASRSIHPADALVPLKASRALLTIDFELLNLSEQKLVHSLGRWSKHKSDVYIRSGSRRPASEQEKRDLIATYPWLWIRSNYPISEHPKDDEYQPHFLERYFESGPLGDEISKFRLVKVCEPGDGESFTVCDKFTWSGAKIEDKVSASERKYYLEANKVDTMPSVGEQPLDRMLVTGDATDRHLDVRPRRAFYHQHMVAADVQSNAMGDLILAGMQLAVMKEQQRLHLARLTNRASSADKVQSRLEEISSAWTSRASATPLSTELNDEVKPPGSFEVMTPQSRETNVDEQVTAKLHQITETSHPAGPNLEDSYPASREAERAALDERTPGLQETLFARSNSQGHLASDELGASLGFRNGMPILG